MEKQIQKKIKELRKEKGLTLRQLAEKVGCTPSYISQLEKGLTLPSLSMVGRLATALNINVIDLFNEVSNGEEKSWHLRRAERKTIDYPGRKVSSQLLVTKLSTKKMEPLISTIKPGGTSDSAENMSHPQGTEEFVLVLKGEIEFNINDNNILLREGDSLNFDGTLPHRWVNNGKKSAEVLFVFSPPIW